MDVESRYKWKEMPEDYHASYYNQKDYADGKKFVIIDTKTGYEYEYPLFRKKMHSLGFEYNERYIDYELYNKEFMYWACSTSPDFSRYLGEEFIDEKMMEILVTTPQSSFIFDRPAIASKLNQDLCNKAFATNPEVYYYLPKKFITLDMVDFYVTLPNASLDLIPEGMLNAENFKKLFTHLSNDKIFELIKSLRYRKDYDINYITEDIACTILETDITLIGSVPSKYISEEHSKKAISKNGRFLKYVPENFRTKDLCDKAFESNPEESIAFIPKQFHNLDMHKKVVDIRISYVSKIPEEVLSDDIIYYTLSKGKSALRFIPETRKTKEICDYAFSVTMASFPYIPAKFKTYDMCFKAVLFDPNLIKRVPVEILNREFIEELKHLKFIIPLDAADYVKECLIANEKLENEDFSIKENNTNAVDKMVAEVRGDYDDFSTIPLANLNGFFTNSILPILHDNGIITLGDLFSASENPNFISSFEKLNKYQIRELLATIKLLRCKYLDEDPLIEEDDSLDLTTILIKFGFSANLIKFLMKRRSQFSFYWNEEFMFFEAMRNPEKREFILRKLEKLYALELTNKIQVLFDYHDRHKPKEVEISDVEKHQDVLSNESSNNNDNEKVDTLKEKNSSDEQLIPLYDKPLDSSIEELLRLREEAQRINDRINDVLSIIQKKKIEQTKGGVLK